MHILVAHGQRVEDYPPVRNLVDVLTRSGHYVTLMTKYDSEIIVSNQSLLKLIRIPENDNQVSIGNAFSYFKKKKFMRSIVESEMLRNDVLWTTTDSTVRDLGPIVLKYKHVMQLMELIEDIPAFPGINFFKLHIKKYAQKAYRVVVPEYNRAHIQKVWWDLKQLPCILPNKMAQTIIPEPPENVKEIIERVNNEKRKIILYQGSFNKDRELSVFAEAISRISDRYVLYLMGKDSDERKRLCEKFTDIQYVPFIRPPFHLLVTQKAYIGLLPYVPEKVDYNSPLNVLYCAPNKIYEFSGYGIPMIGNDLPGITLPLERFNLGMVRKKGTIEEIVDLVNKIDADYEMIYGNCKLFYQKNDLDKIVYDILS